MKRIIITLCAIGLLVCGCSNSRDVAFKDVPVAQVVEYRPCPECGKRNPNIHKSWVIGLGYQAWVSKCSDCRIAYGPEVMPVKY